MSILIRERQSSWEHRKFLRFRNYFVFIFLYIFSFQASAVFPNPLVNTATVTAPAGISDPTPANNTASDSNTLLANADLSLTKVVDNATPSVGANVNFTVTVTNNGPSGATNVAVLDQLPAGYTYVSDTPSVGTYNSGTGVWTVGALANAASETLVITATVNASGPYDNIAQVSASDQADPDSTPNNNVPAEDDQDNALTTPVASADLSLTKVVDNATPSVGANVNFTVTVTNNGPSGATNVAVLDQLPAGYTYVSDTPSVGTYNSGTGVWTVGALANAASETLVITATVNASGPYDNIAQVSASDQADPDSTPNNNVPAEDDQDNALTTPVASADLSLTKVVDNATPSVGANVNFTVTVTNNGPSGATNVAVLDQLPAGYTYVSDTPSVGTYNSGTGVWTVGALANAASETLVITATVNASGPYDNIAQVSASDQADPDSTPNNNVPAEDDQDNALTTPVASADLSLTKVVDNATPSVGANVNFTVTVTNNGPSGATNVAVLDQLPAGYTYVSDTPSVGTYNSGTGVWTVGALANAASETLVITATVNASGPYDNIAQVSASDQADPDSTPNNNVPAEDDQDNALTTPVASADLSLTKVVDNATPSVGANVNFTVTVTNNGPSGATNVAVLDQLPAGYTYVSDTPSVGTYNSGTGVWTVGALANAASETLVITATVNASGPYDNIAQVSASDQADPDSTPNNNVPAEDDQDNALTTPVASADLSLTKVVDNATPSVGANVNFTVTVTNNGPSGATNVAVLDQLPAGYTYVSDTPSVGTYNSGTGVWTVGALANAASETLVITATVNASGPYDNIAQVSASDQADPDSTPNNNVPAEDDQDNALTTPVASADLSLTKVVDNATPSVGANVNFTVTVTNNGPSGATNVAVLDQLPAGYTYVSDTPSVGTYNSGTGVWTVGALANAASETLVITATVNASGPYDNIAQVSASDQADPDSTPNNNVPAEDDQDNALTTPVASADLSLTKVVDNATPSVGANVNFTVTVTNNGPSGATNVAVLDQLPAGYTYVSDTPSVGTYNSGTGVWTVGALANAASETLVITATVNASGPYDNIAQVSASDQADPDSTPNNNVPAEDDQDNALTTPVASADLSLTKVVDNATPSVGANVNFTVTVTNNGPSGATNVAVLDQLPAGYTYVSDTPSVGTYNSGTGVWTVGALANAASETLVITATVNASGPYDNIAQVSASDQADPDSTPNNNVPAEDDQDNALTTPVASADLSLTKVVDNATPSVGANVNFTVTVTNNGPSGATNVAVLDQLPAGYTYVSDTPSVGTYNSGTGVWTVGALANAASETLVITATVNASGPYDNIAQVSASDQADPDSTPNNNVPAEDDQDNALTTPVASADLSLTKVVDNATPSVGANVNFTVTVTNNGPSGATNVAVLDQLPAGYTYVSDTPSVGTYNSGTGVWTVGALANAASETLVITATVNASGPYDNIAQVSASDQADPDSTPNNNVPAEDDQDNALTTPVASADLSLTKVVDNATPSVGANVNFTVTVTNNGPSGATNVAVLDQLPAGYTYVSDTPSVGTYNSGTGVWTVGALANAASETLVITATVNASGPYDNIAQVSASDQADPDSTPNNNVPAEDDQDNALTTPVASADLSLTKVVDNATPSVGANVNFTVTVTNNGPSGATNVAVLDQLPAGYTYVSDTPSVGTYNSGTGVWTVGALANAASETLVITATVNASGPYDNIAQVSASDQADPDSTPNNNVPAEDDQDNALTTPVASADLSLTKVVDNATPSVGANVNFTVTVTNNGPSGATNVAVLDQLPAGYTYVSDTPSVGTYNSGTGVWTVGALANAASETLVITATVNASGPYDNIAQVSASDQADPDSTPNNNVPAEDDQDNALTTPVASADLSLTKVVDNATPSVGANVNFTVTVTNNGPSGATNVAVLDQLPAGYTYVSDTPSVGTYNSGTGVWTVGALANAASETLVITATVNASGPYDNIAQVSASDQADPDSTPNNNVPAEDDQDNALTTPVASADLSLTKVVDNATPSVGANVNFTVTVTNNGPSGATNVAVLDQLPAGYTYVSDTPSVGTYNSGTGVWTVGALANAASETLVITATVNASGPYDNIAQVSASDQADPDSTPNNNVPAEDDQDNALTTPVASADLSLTKVVDNATPSVGANVNFTVTVTNNGPSGATNVAVLDQLPAGYTYVSDTPSVGTYNSGTGVWTVGALANAASETLVITATVNASGPYDNIAQVSASDQADPDSTPNNNVPAEDDQDNALTTPVASADLSLTKVVDNATPSVGANVNFTVTVTNNGPSGATNVAVLDQLPAGYTYVSDTPSVGTYNSGTGVWTVGALANAASETLVITATVNASGPYDNIAQVSASDQADPDSTPNNNVPAEDDQDNALTTPVASADLSLTKVVDNATPSVGANVNFTVTVTNNGPSGATNVAVLDQLPAGYTYVSDTPSVGTYNSGTGVWTVGALANAASETLVITATVNASGPYDNIAQVSASDQADPDSTPNNNVPAEDDQDNALTTPVASADLSLTKVVDNATPSVGANVNFTVTVTNNGPSGATNVAVLDQLPAGYTYVSDTPSVGTYNSGTGVWTVGALANAASETLVITATVNASGPYDNIAQVSASDQADPDSTPNNNVPAEDDQDNALTTPVASADLSLTKVVDNATPSVGANVNFTVTVTNNGPSGATNVAVLDQLPAGYTYVSDTPSVGTYNSGTGVWTVGALANAASETLVITATVNASGPYDNIAQVSASDQADPDSTPNNNVPAEDDQDNALTTPVASADLSLTKVVDNATPSVGANVNFTVTVTNNGPSGATNVAVLDQLPAGYTYVSDTPSVGTYNSGTGVWTVGALANAASETLVITATVNASGPYDNIAQVSASDQADPDSTPNNNVPAEDDQDNALTTPVASADLSLTKVVDNATPSVGANVNFTVTVTNNGPSGATNVAVLDQLPAGYTYVSDTPSVGTYNSGTGVWTVGALANAASETLVITATVNASGPYDNIAQVSASDQADPDSTPNNNVPAEDDQDNALTTPVAGSAVSVVKQCVPDTIIAGTPTLLTITLGNTGSVDATLTADMLDNMPTGMNALAINPATSCPSAIDISNPNIIRYPVGAVIPAGGCDIAVDVTSASQGTSTNIIPIGALQTNLGNNLLATSDDLTVIGDPLGFFYCEDTGQVIPGGSVSFTAAGAGIATLLEDGSSGRYQATFNGTDTYTMNITVPPGTALSTARPVDPANYVSPVGAPNPTLLGSGATGGFLTDFTAATNTPWFDGFDFVSGDPIILNNNIPLTNCASFATPVLLTKTANPDQVVIGDVVQYTLNLENNSISSFTNIDVVDNIPGGFSYVEDSALLIAAGPDDELNTNDDIETTISVTGSDPITFEDIDIDVNESVQIRYLLRVSSGVVEGEYENTAQVLGAGSSTISNVASASVVVTQDSILQKTTIIGKVFNDRDEDGWQDSAHATNVTIKSEHFGWDGHDLGTVYGRASEFDSIEENQLQVRMPLNLEGDNSFVIESSEGTIITVDNDGNVNEEYKGSKHKGLTAQDLTISTARENDELVITISNHGIQEAGIPGVRLATVEGLLVETDQYGRYHLADIDGGRWERGRNFIIKVDPATLPEGAVFTTENPRVLRITQALMSKFNFGVKLPAQEVALTERAYGAAKRVKREVEVVETREIKDVVDPIYFNSGKANISQQALNALQQEIERLQDKEKVIIRVVGHADNQQLSASTKAKFEDNHGLARARATQVAEILQRELQLSDEMITIVEHGAQKPIAPNDTAEGRAKNRRAEIDVVYDERYTKTVVEIDYTPPPEPIIKREAQIPNGGAIWAVEDPATIDPRLNVIAQGAIVRKNRKVKDPINFTLYSNYIAFIDRWELAIYAHSDRDLIKPIEVITGNKFTFTDTIEWQAQNVDEKYFEEGESLTYVLRVFDEQGRMDETAPRPLAVADERIIKVQQRDLEQDQEDVALASYGESNLLRQTIPLAGSRVRVNGVDLDTDYTITVNGERVIIDENGKFVLEQHLPIGKHQMLVKVTDNRNIDFERNIDVDVTGKYMFMVGLANLTVGENSLSGSVEPLGDDDHFDEDVWVDGRVAFYLKGKIKGKYLVTAQLDTTEDELHNLGDRLEEEDPSAIFRRLDPDQFYAVYGDDSTTIDDTDSQGAFYLRVDWDKSMALWGNYNTDLTGTEFAQYNRSLYGAKLEHRNVDVTKFGEHKHEVHVFGSEAQTAAAHNEFISTGGSLYYLRDRDIVQGSDKVWVEVRTRDSEQIVETITLEHGRDYDIDYIQGRIILTRPLTQFDFGSGPTIIKDTPLDGNDVFLLVDYEYLPDSFSADDVTSGARGKAWLNDYIALGGTYVNEDRDGVDYELKGTDVTLQAGKGTYLRLEFAESDAKQADNNFISANGGLSFSKQNSSDDEPDGEAKGIEARINFAELSDHEGYVLGWWKDRDAGFSSAARLDDGIETIDTGIEAQWQATERLDLTTRATKLDKKTQSEFSAVSVQGNYDVNDKLNVGLELRHENEEDDVLNEEGDATLAGAEIRYDLTDHTEVYTSGQFVIEDSGDYESNALGTVGIQQQVSERLALKGELATGDRGDAVILGMEYDVTPNMNISLDAGFGSGATSQIGTNYTTASGLDLYGSYATDPDRTDSGESIFTFGTRKRYGNGLHLYSENQFGEGENVQSVARTYGLDFDLTEQWRLSASVQKNDIDDDLGDIDRRAATLGANYYGDDLKLGSVLEYREDSNAQTNEDATQWVTTNTIEWQQSESLRWLGKADLSTTHSDENKGDEARYVELDLGFAYRPAFNDRLNILGKYTFIYDLASSGQDTSLADQRSHVFALESIYDLTQKWEVGAKIAYKTGDTRVTRGSGPWFETGAHLAVARARYHMLKKWDALFEYRWLETEEQDDNKDGALVGVYRHVGKHMKVGTGYNFTDFSDDLTDNDYDSHGWFFDITGKY